MEPTYGGTSDHRTLDLIDALGMAAHRLDGAAGLAECVAAAPFVPDTDALEALAEAARHGAEEARRALERAERP